MGKNERGKKLLKHWPKVTDQEIEKMNALFLPYIFYQNGKKTVTVWTSCCRRKETVELYPRTETPEHREFLLSLKHNETAKCPWCGKTATAKAYGRGRGGLRERHLVVLLHAKGRAIYADAVALRKDYESDKELTAPPCFYLSQYYYFAEGEAIMYDYQIYGNEPWIEREEGRLSGKKKVEEPFKRGSIGGYSHESYMILNEEEISKSPFYRYCGYFDHWIHRPYSYYGSYIQKADDLISYLTVYSIYPRQLEMLVKAQMWEPVRSMVFGRKKWAEAMRWEEQDPRKSFRMTGAELKWVLEHKPDMDTLRIRNRANRWFDMKWSPEDAESFCELWEPENADRCLSLCRERGIKPDKLVRYLSEQAGGNAGIIMPVNEMFDFYRDYLTAAYANGKCMEHSRVLWPENLLMAHDNETALMDAKQAKEQALAREERRLKYEFEMDGLTIIFPMTGAAIKREGKALNHCVGGYAERHMKGVLSILFLRRSETPQESLVTIEMDGNRMVQIHGWDDERTPCADNPKKISPAKIYKEFLDTWMNWLKRGSPRNKDGTPKLPKKKKEVHAA